MDKNQLIYFKVEASKVTKWQAKSKFAVRSPVCCPGAKLMERRNR